MTLEGLNEDFRDLLVLLADADVEFVIVGAYALAFHGAPRASGDIDLFVRPSAVNAGRVFDVLARFGAAHRPPDRDLGRDVRRGLGVSRSTAEVDGRTVSFIGREALIKNKEASGRLEDAADVARLRKTR